jgi:hypothetical protein
MKAPPAGPPDDNWGDDLSDQVPASQRPNYLKWRARIRACDANDEVIAIAGYLDAHTRINLDTADRIERAARASLAAQKATLFFTRYLRLLLRRATRVPFLKMCLVIITGLVLAFGLAWVHWQSVEQAEIVQVRLDAQQEKAKEMVRWKQVYSANSQLLGRLADSGIELGFTDQKERGFAVWSSAAYKSKGASLPDGTKVGALFFHSADQPAAPPPVATSPSP